MKDSNTIASTARNVGRTRRHLLAAALAGWAGLLPLAALASGPVNIDAQGVAQGVKPGIDPGAFAVVDGKLYLNLSPDIQERWQADIPGQIRKAARNWLTLRDQ